MKKLLVLGYFGYNTNQLDGQTVKTRDIYRLAKEQENISVDYYDTEYFQYHKMSIFTMFLKVIKCDVLFYIPAHNNLKYIFPIIYLLGLVFRFKIHYFVVGGWLREFLANLPVHRYMLKRIKGIHAETNTLKEELEKYYGFSNIDKFPNFRFFNFNPIRSESNKLRIVFMARINKMKGLDWCFDLASYIKNNKLDHKFSLTFYGPVLEKDYFHGELSKYDFVEYKGVLQPQEIYGALGNYDVLILPTHYYTEGLPGTVVDAYISGLPVIVTEWKHAREFVDDAYSGYIIPFENGEAELINKVLMLEGNRELLKRLQSNVLIKRYDFAPPSIQQYL